MCDQWVCGPCQNFWSHYAIIYRHSRFESKTFTSGERRSFVIRIRTHINQSEQDGNNNKKSGI